MSGRILVAKFGGTSLASAEQIKKVINIIRSDMDRKHIIVSAPGKRNKDDQKITDLFYEWYRLTKLKVSASEIQQIIEDRFAEIIEGLGVEFDLKGEMSEIAKNIETGASADYAASRGEYLNGKIIALALGYYQFIDPSTCIFFNKDGIYDVGTCSIQEKLSGRRTVIPGFYGSLPDGSIKTFSRGGSDITGAIVASAVKANIYENWTDVSGFRMTDPKVVKDAKKIHELTYRELRELSYMGANVFHEEAMFPVQEAGITTNIRNTNDPDDSGTLITISDEFLQTGCLVTGIAGRKNFTVIIVEKKMMNQQVGFVRRILTILEENNVSFEHMPSGIDTLSIIIDDAELQGKHERILSYIEESCQPDSVKMERSEMAMIAVVGHAMVHMRGVAARALYALAQARVNIRMINQGASELSIIVGINNDDYETSIRALYDVFSSSHEMS